MTPSSCRRTRWTTKAVALAVLILLPALAGCDSEGIPVSGEVLEIEPAGAHEISATVQVANDGRERTDVRCEITLVDDKGEQTGFTLVEPALDPGETRAITTAGPGAPEARYSLDDATVSCRSE